VIVLDESPHPESKLEWWFVHGRFAAGTGSDRYFMVTVFRFQVPGPEHSSSDAFYVMISVLDAAGCRQYSSTRVDPRVLDALRKPDSARAVDPYSPEVALDELRSSGLPREFLCPESVPVLSSGLPHLHFRWADLVFETDSTRVILAFDAPGLDKPVQLVLTPAAPRLRIDAANEVCQEDGMDYVTYPQMNLAGSMDGLPVTGEAWFDHQWGGTGWFENGDTPAQQRGWDWLGACLDDGSCWLLGTHWDARTKAVFARHLTIRDAAGEVRLYRDFEWEPLRWWSSPATRVRYPVEWRLRVPERNAELTFSPFVDHQEVRAFGPQRTIWEGAGRVSGSVQGGAVEGAARLEIHGLGYLFDLPGYLRGWAEPVDEAIAAFLPHDMKEQDVCRFAGPPDWIYEPDSYTRMLSQPLWDLLRRDGKRWRAVFSFLLLEALGGDPHPVSDVIFILPELLHNASLIIDDIQDDAFLRRGDETIHRRYGLDVAISAANTAYFLPLLVVLDHAALAAAEKRAISEIYQRLLVRAHLGQSLDLFWSHTLTETQLEVWMADSIGPKILQMYALKTGAAVEGLSEVALLLSRSPEAARSPVVRFARSLGLSFQLVDDVNNFSDSPAWGKQRGEDLRTGKLTYVILCALRKLNPGARLRLRQILCRPELRSDPSALQDGIDLIMTSGACTQVRREARAMVLPAWEELSRVIPASTAKTELRILWESLLGAPFERDELLQ
jgi:geranylgeranyl pyrophosphate synthase/predicted secreted hydrolase